MKLKSILLAIVISITTIYTAAAQAPPISQRILRLLIPTMRFIPAVTFDGNTLLTYRNKSLYNIPDRTPTFFTNIWFKTVTAPGMNVQSNLLVADANDNVSGGYVAAVTLNQYPDGVRAIFFAGCGPAAGPNSWYTAASQELIPINGKWQSLTLDVVSNGSTKPTVRMLLDKTPLNTPVSEGGGKRCQFEWTKVVNWTVAGDGPGPDGFYGLFYTGDMAEVIADMTGALTINDVDKFVTLNQDGSRALGMKFQCLGPTGNVPQLCLRGHAGYFPLGPGLADPRNFGSYGFELNEGGTLQTAKSDPCLVRRYGNGCWPASYGE